MKKNCAFLILKCLFVHTVFSQTLFHRIEETYNGLDSVSYIENTISMYKEKVKKEIREMDNLLLELAGFDYNNIDSIQRNNLIDSITGKTNSSESRIKERTGRFSSAVLEKPLHFVLNLHIDSCAKNDENIRLLPDSSSMPFNLFYFDKHSNFRFVVFFENDQISHYDEKYRTFSKPIGKNAPKVFKEILRKKPKYLLYCHDLEQMNTILYIIDDEICLYRIAQKKKYELSEYKKKFLYSK